jgi:uncharacterized protein (TIGR02679 family)
VNVPQSLSEASLQALWRAARTRLDRGDGATGTIACPELSEAGLLALASLLGRRPTGRIALGDVERALVVRNVGRDLDGALTALGHPASPAAAERRASRARREAAYAILDASVAEWPEPWAAGWADEVRSAGLFGDLDAERAGQLIGDVRLLLDRIGTMPPASAGTSRTELAAQLFGSAHALDQGIRRTTLVTYALRRLVGPLEGRELWEAAGISPDRVSAPVLIWQLPVVGDGPLAAQLGAANAGQLPVHLSLLALRRHPVEVPPGTVVYLVENPRIVEAAAERGVPAALIAGNGNPSSAVTTLVGQLQTSGALVRYHGDFDAAGIAICARLHAAGVVPWRMSADDYRRALARAEAQATPLDQDVRDCPPTPWDNPLAATFNSDRRIVHEELVVEDIIAAIGS